ncbi:MAG: TonB C-terminal domain-containing protein [Alphaproteobacteria bacterium]|nr:TonB C-terminal domain-containing protein [Alphaproteobacteria bacterium]
MGRVLDRHASTRQRAGSWWRRTLPFVALALLLHVLGGNLGLRLLPYFQPDRPDSSPARLVVLEPPPEEEPDAPEDEPEPQPEGQIVELPPPPEEQRPEDADYLAEHDVTVDKETRTDQFEVNPEVLSPVWSEEQKLEQEDLVDLDVDKPSTGAQVGNKRFDPDRDGNMAALPSPWTLTNKEGPQDPVPASHTAAARSGAPQNDLLDEDLGDQVAVNAKEYLYAGYLNRIRRLVNFYWKQNVDNLPGSTRLVKSAYTTAVEVVLDGTGGLEIVEVTRESGSGELDHCVVSAFRLAGPFPNPPEGLIEKDGRVYLPGMSFTVTQGQARMHYEGVDPRAGVQFPGMLKSPR